MSKLKGKFNALLLGLIVILFVIFSKGWLSFKQFQLWVAGLIFLHIFVILAFTPNRLTKIHEAITGDFIQRTRVLAVSFMLIGLAVQFTIPLKYISYDSALIGLAIAGLSIVIWYLSVIFESYGGVPSVITRS